MSTRAAIRQGVAEGARANGAGLGLYREDQVRAAVAAPRGRFVLFVENAALADSMANALDVVATTAPPTWAPEHLDVLAKAHVVIFGTDRRSALSTARALRSTVASIRVVMEDPTPWLDRTKEEIAKRILETEPWTEAEEPPEAPAASETTRSRVGAGPPPTTDPLAEDRPDPADRFLRLSTSEIHEAIGNLDSLSEEQRLECEGEFEYIVRRQWLELRDGWPERPDVPGAPEPDALPPDALPDVLARFVGSVAASVQIAPDVPLLLSLAAVSAAAAGKVEVRVDDAWTREWCAFFCVPILAPGERKSAAFAAATAPLREWQDDRTREVMPRHRAGLDVVEVRERELAKAKESAAKGGAIDTVEAARLKLEGDRARVPALPALLASDATPEALVLQMSEHGGRVAVLSSEGGPLRILDGRYSPEAGVRLEELCQGYDGEAIDTRRIGRECRPVRRPALTLAVCIQPSVLESMQNSRSMRGQGLFGRIAWCRPPSGMGERVDSAEAPALDQEARQHYAQMLRTLLDWEPAGTEDDGTPVPHVLRLSPEAAATKKAFHYETESELGAGGKLHGISDWAGKAVGRAIRIAALLDLAARADEGRPLTGPINGWAMESAVRISRALTTHALAVFGEMDMDPRASLLAYVLRRLQSLPAGSSVRDLFQASKGRASIASVEDLDGPLNELVDRGCIRITAQPSTGGRPPSPQIELHPDLARAARTPIPKRLRSAPSATGSVTSETSEHAYPEKRE